MDIITAMYVGFYISGLINGFFLGFMVHLILSKKRNRIEIKPEPEELKLGQFGMMTNAKKEKGMGRKK